jgi:hypothetical protein
MLEYQKGDLFKHVQHGDVIAHCCNDVGAWGAGFTRALSVWHNKIAQEFHAWADGTLDYPAPLYELGETLIVPFRSKGKNSASSTSCPPISFQCYIANMVGQHGLIGRGNPHPVRYDALKSAMEKVPGYVESYMAQLPYRIIAPKFGAGLAGGDWNKIEKLINEVWKDQEVVIFELE